METLDLYIEDGIWIHIDAIITSINIMLLDILGQSLLIMALNSQEFVLCFLIICIDL